MLVAVPAVWFLSNRAKAPEINQPSTATAVEPASVTPPPAAVKPSYTVKAVLLRSRNGVETPVTAGTPLAAGDQLAMRIEASTEVHVYVLNADDTGKAFRLYPLPENGLTNPLSPSTPHRLPDATQNWVVTSEGGREHFMVMVSPTRDEAADAVFRAIPPVTSKRAEAANLEELDRPSAVGRRTEARRRRPMATKPSCVWFDDARELTGQQETASGAWVRQLIVPGSTR